MDRRSFLLSAMAAAAVSGGIRAPLARAQTSLFDLRGRKPDQHGVILPEGFRARVIARSTRPVAGTDYTWPIFPDGGATFADDDGGWVYVANSEVPETGGVSAIRFDADGEIMDAYSILQDTTLNCAGGATPWGTWLSGEEYDAIDENGVGEAGFIWECDPMRPGQGTALRAMGAFQHEAAGVDPDREQVYLTEDRPDGRFYRFTPTAYPDLSDGLLEVAVVEGRRVRWAEIPDPSGTERGPVRNQVAESTVFLGGEGIVVRDGEVFFTTKLDNKVWRYDPGKERLDTVYDLAEHDGALSGVDNITVLPTGELLVAEDGGNMELVLVADDGSTVPILRIVGEDHSELAGPAFDPSGRRLYFSSQRGGPDGVGITFEVTGPFVPEPDPEPTTTTEVDTTTSTSAPPDGDDGADLAAPGGGDGGDGGTSWAVPAIGGAAAVLLGAAAVWRLRNRGADPEAGAVGTDPTEDGPGDPEDRGTA
jgi:uncharacterized protein